MMKDNGLGVVIIGIYILAVWGYIANIYKLTECDFDKPYKAEVIRVVGIVVPPVGCVTGFMHIDD